jgi:hypothetical protein
MRRIFVLCVLSTIGHHNTHVRHVCAALFTLFGFALIHAPVELIVFRWGLETLGAFVQFFGFLPFTDTPLLDHYRKEFTDSHW